MVAFSTESPSNTVIRKGRFPHQLLGAGSQAGAVNCDQNLSGIDVGLHDKIFQGTMPVLAGVDAASTYCYLLAAADHRDADTWGVHLLDATEQGLKPDYTIADAAQGLRAGQKAAWDDTPCHGDVFHIQRQYEGLANTLSRLAKGATSRRKKLEARIDRAGQRGPDGDLVFRLELARQTETRANRLARDIRTLSQSTDCGFLKAGEFGCKPLRSWDFCWRAEFGVNPIAGRPRTAKS